MITGATEKTTPVDADQLGITDSAASGALKRLTFANLWTWVKSKLDTVLTIAGAKTFSGQLEATGQAATNLTSLMTAELLASPSIVILRDDFTQGRLLNGNVLASELGWFYEWTGSGSITGVSASSNRVGVTSINTGSVSGNFTSIYLAQTGFNFCRLLDERWNAMEIFRLGSTANIRAGWFFAAGGSTGAWNNWSGSNYFGIRYFSDVDGSNLKWTDGTNQTDTGVSALSASANFVRAEMRCSADGVVQGRINGGAWVQIASGKSTSDNYSVELSARTLTTASKSLETDFFSYLQTGLTR